MIRVHRVGRLRPVTSYVAGGSATGCIVRERGAGGRASASSARRRRSRCATHSRPREVALHQHGRQREHAPMCRTRIRCRPAESRRQGAGRGRADREPCCCTPARFSRRTITRPGSGGAAASAAKNLRVDPLRHQATFPAAVGRELVFRRHLAGSELQHDEVPRVRRGSDVGRGLEFRKVEAALVVPRVVAVVAMFRKEWLNRRLERGGHRRGAGARPGRGQATEAEKGEQQNSASHVIPSIVGVAAPTVKPRRDVESVAAPAELAETSAVRCFLGRAPQTRHLAQGTEPCSRG